MEIIHIKKPSEEQFGNMRELAEECRLLENLSISFPEDMEEYWLAFEEELLGFFAACHMDEELWECAAFVRQEYRRRGIFTELLEEAADYIEGLSDSSLVFASDKRSPGAEAALESMEASFWYEEYMMELALSDRVKSGKREPAPLQMEALWTDDDLCKLELGENEGTCMLAFSGSRVYLYGLNIREDLRGRGVGTAFLERILEMLESRGISQVRLQVAGDNERALRLYKKAGFRITETLAYYLY